MNIKKIKIVWDYKLKLNFEDWVSWIVDLTPKSKDSIFSIFKNRDFFSKAHIEENGTVIRRPNGIDIPADARYYRFTNHNPFIV